MKNVLRKLYESFYQQQDYALIEQRIEENYQHLICSLSSEHRKIVLRIIDDKNCINSRASYDSFVQWVMLGLNLKEQLDRYNKAKSNNKK